jgi:putative ABC transport system permease protein
MNPLPDIIERFKALFLRGRIERELDEELQYHIDRETEARANAGASEPRRDALRMFGGVERVKEEVRDARGVRPLEEWAADARYALRALRRNIGFTISVLAVLGIGIGAATAVFTVVERVLFSSLPYDHADRLVRIYQKNSPSHFWSLSVVDIQAIAAQQRTFESFGAAQYGSASIAGPGSPERVAVGRVTSGFFEALGVRAAAGRLLEPADDAPGAPPAVVVSSRLAERTFGSTASAVGRALTIDGISHEIVGVLEPERRELAGMPAEVWPDLQLATPSRRGPFGYRGIARLKKGVTLDQATRDLAGISVRIFPLWASGFQDRTARLTPVPLRDSIVGRANRQVGLFAGAVALVLLLAVANVATLMLVRTSAREQELAVRAALGASRRRIAQLILIECLTLTALAGVAGLGLGALALKATALVAPDLPRLGEVGLGLTGVAGRSSASRRRRRRSAGAPVLQGSPLPRRASAPADGRARFGARSSSPSSLWRFPC